MSWLQDSLNWLFTSTEEQTRTRVLSQQAVDMVDAEYARGLISEEERLNRINRIVGGANDQLENRIPELEPAYGFGQGWNEGVENIKRTTGEVIDQTARTAFGIIPWQAWLIAGLVAIILIFPYLKKS